MHVNEKHKNDINAALEDSEGLMVIGVFFDVKDKRTNMVREQTSIFYTISFMLYSTMGL